MYEFKVIIDPQKPQATVIDLFDKKKEIKNFDNQVEMNKWLKEFAKTNKVMMDMP